MTDEKSPETILAEIRDQKQKQRNIRDRETSEKRSAIEELYLELQPFVDRHTKGRVEVTPYGDALELRYGMVSLRIGYDGESFYDAYPHRVVQRTFARFRGVPVQRLERNDAIRLAIGWLEEHRFMQV